MPNVIHEVKLDFKDVLLRPKRSSIRSRADVEIRRKFTFLHSKRVHEGVPIIASNMDTVGTFEMAKTLAKVRNQLHMPVMHQSIGIPMIAARMLHLYAQILHS